MSTFTNIKLFPITSKNAGKLLARGTVTIAGVVDVKFTVMEGSNGIFASLPARKGNKPGEDGKIPWYPEVFISDQGLRAELQELVRGEYAKLTGTGQGDNTNAGEENQTPGGNGQYQDNVPF